MLRLAPVVPCVLFAAAAAVAQAPEAELVAKLDGLCQPLVDADLAVGLVVGVIDGPLRVVKGYGAVARGKDQAPDGTTLYEIGSVSKVFTGLLLADAVERGLVALDDRVQKHLPEGVTMPTFRGTPVLLWHLSTHTSGLPRLAGMDGGNAEDPYAHFTTAHLHEALGDVRVRWEPGSKYEYSNLAVGLLGCVLVRANGQSSYDALLQARIAQPLQMNDTRVQLDAARAGRLAPPHDADGEPNHTWDLAALAGAGGIRSSMDDMLKFAAAQLLPEGAPLAAASRLAMEKRHDGQAGIAVGLGWHVARDGVTRWHNGQTGGYHAWIGVQPQLRRAACVLTNTAGGEIDAVGERILQHLHGMAVQPLATEKPVAVERAVLQRCVGRYRMSPTVHFEITLRERGLFAQLTGQPALRILPRSPTEFFYRAVPASITFETDGEAVTGLVLHQNGRDMRARRLEAEKPPGK